MNDASLPSGMAPVLLKTEEEQWCDDDVFYILGRDGLYLCRNHAFFRSCVKTERGPGVLEEQEPFLRPRFPKIPQDLFELTVGFFDRVAERQNSEAAVLLLWDRQCEQVRLVVPPQKATMHRTYDGRGTPIGVHYDLPLDLPTDWIPFGDIHSHVNYPAYASATDVEDEIHAAGLHVVVGRIHREPPEVHVEAVVDRQRFRMTFDGVVEGYETRQLDVPEEWIEQVEIVEEGSSWTPMLVS
jgi:proteasome lid subunit RPN8/RPN11